MATSESGSLRARLPLVDRYLTWQLSVPGYVDALSRDESAEIAIASRLSGACRPAAPGERR